MTIAVFLTAMVTVLFSTLIGCRGCNSEEEVVHWIPAPRDTIPVVVENSSDMEPEAVDEIVVAIKPARNKQPVSEYNGPDKPQESYRQAIRPWPEELDPDSIELTIITSDLEMQIIMQKFD
ncbi:MAG: hypothetical protein LBF17_03150 [Mediterranea sp.]|nr:hypothetical protein [Mediterranea sp.]